MKRLRPDRPVAMLDILGLSALMKKRGLAGALAHYSGLKINEQVSRDQGNSQSLDVLVFSDTVAVAAREGAKGTRADVRAVVAHVALLLANSIRFYESFEVPLRGGLAFGEYLLQPQATLNDESWPLFVGAAVAEAHRWESAQEWVGASISPRSAVRLEETHPGLLDDLVQDGWLKRHAIPVKGCEPIDGFAVNYVNEFWASHLEKTLNDAANIVAPAVRHQYTNAVRFVVSIRAAGTWAPLPPV